jgi:hypothetical protein
MARLNGKGPENNGSGTGRSLGNCSKNPEKNSIQYKLGQGMGEASQIGNY